MGKIIKITENQLKKLIDKQINEQESNDKLNFIIGKQINLIKRHHTVKYNPEIGDNEKITEDSEISGVISSIDHSDEDKYFSVPMLIVKTQSGRANIMYDKKTNEFIEGRSIYHVEYLPQTSKDGSYLKLFKMNFYGDKNDDLYSDLNEDSNSKEDGTYMVLSNLVMIKDYVDTILKHKHNPKFSSLVTGEHAWAADHIATSKDDIQEVANFVEAQMERDELSEEKMKGKDPCWKGYEMVGKKMKNGKEVPNCVPKKKKIEEDIYGSVEETNFIADDMLNEAEYKGRKVKLGKIMQGDVKKFKVYVKNDKGNVVKVNFGDPNMRIKKSNPERRKSFRARHRCDNPGPRWKARYWACKTW